MGIILDFDAAGPVLRRINADQIAKGTVGARAAFALDSAWDGRTVTATWTSDVTAAPVGPVAVTDGACVIPWEVLRGSWADVYLTGTLSADDRLTSGEARIYVRPNDSEKDATTPVEPSETLYDEMVAHAATIDQQATAAAHESAAASASAQAAQTSAAQAAQDLAECQTSLNGKADLVNGTVPSSQLPSYVDDVLEAASFSSLPATGETGKIYVTLDDNQEYRWSGSVYVQLSKSIALGETADSAYRGDHGKVAYDHSQITGNPHGATPSDLGLGNVDNTSDANKPVSTAMQTALDAKADDSTAMHLAGRETATGGKAFSGGIISYGAMEPFPSGVGAYVAAYVSATYGARMLAFDGTSYQPLNAGAMPTAGRFGLTYNADGTLTAGYGLTTPLLTQQSPSSAYDSAPLGSELLSNALSWTYAGWTGSWSAGWTHVTGSTTALSVPLSCATGEMYQLAFAVTGRTAGSFSVALGGQDSGSSKTATGASGIKVVTANGAIVITPTTDFGGTIVLSCKKITGTSSPASAWKDSGGASSVELRVSSSGLANLFFGPGSGRYNTTGGYNSAVGASAMQSNTTGSYNSAVGATALQSNTTGGGNSAVGANALQSNTTGGYDSAVGMNAGRYASDGSMATACSNSAFFGYNTQARANGDINETVVGCAATGNGSNTATVGNSAVTDFYANQAGSATVHAGKLQLSALNTPPASSTDTGTAGEVRFASGYIYVCVATNTWRRAALAAW